MGGRAQRSREGGVRELEERDQTFRDPEPTIYRDRSAFVVVVRFRMGHPDRVSRCKMRSIGGMGTKE
jgi:hypothetical protein